MLAQGARGIQLRKGKGYFACGREVVRPTVENFDVRRFADAARQRAGISGLRRAR
jgi:hypothetical protein